MLFRATVSEVTRWTLDTDRVKAEMGEAWYGARCKMGSVTTIRVSVRTGAKRLAAAVAACLALSACALPISTQYATMPPTLALDCAERLAAGDRCDEGAPRDDFGTSVRTTTQPNSPITHSHR
jgi:hypothetical protein